MILWNSVNLSKYFTVLQESGKRDGLHLTSIKYWSEVAVAGRSVAAHSTNTVSLSVSPLISSFIVMVALLIFLGDMLLCYYIYS